LAVADDPTSGCFPQAAQQFVTIVEARIGGDGAAAWTMNKRQSLDKSFRSGREHGVAQRRSVADPDIRSVRASPLQWLQHRLEVMTLGLCSIEADDPTNAAHMFCLGLARMSSTNRLI